MSNTPSSSDAPVKLPRKIAEGALRLFAERGADKVSISALAQASGVTRATIYNNCPDPTRIFSLVAHQLVTELRDSIAEAAVDEADPAVQLATGMGHFLRRAHEDPVWGAFVLRFALTTENLRSILLGHPATIVRQGIVEGRFSIRSDQVPAVLAMIGGALLGQIWLVIDGHAPWRKAAADLAELFLRALGVDPQEACEIAQRDLPELAKG
ncbi:MAG: TetR/AcrR family transcriptional regulator [Roseinatronobacter sp.]|nr:MAG: TetR/AcrR family transcriptional regulator [Roseinatronobacter sp.]